MGEETHEHQFHEFLKKLGDGSNWLARRRSRLRPSIMLALLGWKWRD